MGATRFTQWLLIVFKVISGCAPSYLCALIQIAEGHYALRSHDMIGLSVPRVRTDWGKRAFSYAALKAWNALQVDLRLRELVSLRAFCSILKVKENESFKDCHCV